MWIDYQTDVLQREKLIVKDASEFLVLHQIPSFVSMKFYGIFYIMKIIFELLIFCFKTY